MQNKSNKRIKPRINPPDYFMVLIILAIILHFILPVLKIINAQYRYLGILFIALGIYLNLWTHFTYKKLKNPVKVHLTPKLLITSGAFKISRNPMYLGMLLILIGECILLGSLISFIIPIIFIILTEIFTIPIEEKNLEKKFGKRYLDYKQKIRRWI